MARPTIALSLIAKNEEKNIPQLFESIRGCFDKIYFCDTGSEDKTIETAKLEAEKIGCDIVIQNFEWIKDFGAARNHSLKDVLEDYCMWLDLDDVLTNKEAFIDFRDNSLEHADYWFATYDYASDAVSGNPVISFMRERIFKTNIGLKWFYFIHEGIPPVGVQKLDYIVTWKVTHKRSVEDIAKDKNRNLMVFEYHLEKGPLDARMTFYYGKELFEANLMDKAINWLLESACDIKLEKHDRLLAIQYAAYASINLGKFPEARQIAYQGQQLDPTRAEYYVAVGDSFLKQNRLYEALPAYSAAKKCLNQAMPGSAYAGAIFAHPDAYRHYPRNMIAQILFNLGRMDEAYEEIQKCWDLFGHADTKHIMEYIEKGKSIAFVNDKAEQTEDIVISCPPQGFYEWDEGIAKTRGVGGSEIAAIEMAKNLKKLTGRRVIIFNPRDFDYVSESGVDYFSTNKVNAYFSRFKPKVHIAWRHNIKLTTAPTYLWCHDLMTPTVESYKNFDKVLCLSQFHKRYVMSRQGLKSDEVIVTRNGINPDRWLDIDLNQKNHNKVVFSSSPDRGLLRAIKVVEEARKISPDLELHAYYGFDNLLKAGRKDVVDFLEAVIKERPWVKFHGNIEQAKLIGEFKDAVVWLYPTDFLETFCITAVEMSLSKVYPLVRKFGSLPDTLSGMKATILDRNCETEDDIKFWASHLINTIKDKKWEELSEKPDHYSWESVAKEWIEIMDLQKSVKQEVIEINARPTTSI